MQEWIKFAIETLKPMGGYAPFSALAISSILLFTLDSWLAKINLLTIRNQYTELLGLAFIISIVATLIQIALWVKKDLWIPYCSRRNSEKRFNNLSVQEKQVLCGYLLNGVKTDYFPLEDGVIQGLVHSKILYRSSDMGSAIHGFAYNIQPWAQEFLEKNIHLITDGVPLAAPNTVQGYVSEADPVRRIFRR